MLESTNPSAVAIEAPTEPRPRFGPWMPHFVAVSAAGTAAFVWCWFGSPEGPEGLMTLGNLADRVMVAVPIAWVFGILELLLANKLVTLAPKAPPWVVA